MHMFDVASQELVPQPDVRDRQGTLLVQIFNIVIRNSIREWLDETWQRRSRLLDQGRVKEPLHVRSVGKLLRREACRCIAETPMAIVFI